MATTSYVDFSAAVRGIGARTAADGSAVTDYGAEEDRLINSLLTEGSLTPNAFKVSAASGMTVTVGSGAAKTDLYAIAGDVAGQGVYIARLEPATVNVTVPAADPSLTRIDEVYLVIADTTYDGGGLALPRVGYRKGVAGSGAPGPDAAWKASVKLASITVGAAVSSINAGNITDTRTASALTPIANPVLLGWAQYDPAGAVTKLTSSAAFAALDTTNLRVTFVAPPSGVVKLEFGAWGSNNGSAADGPIVGVLDGSTVKANSGYQGIGAAGTASSYGPIAVVRRISGLTPGATYTYDLAYASSAAGVSIVIGYGGGVNGYGAAYLFVSAA